ncbi:Multiple sugar transport system permease protein OS=Streptomyces violarus OX=67380 GN=FHS41_000334 PE=3 SV=1 [Streptomyces violarus]
MAAVTTTTSTTLRPVRRRFPFGRAAAWTVMGLIVLITLLPFYWRMVIALSTTSRATDMAEA